MQPGPTLQTLHPPLPSGSLHYNDASGPTASVQNQLPHADVTPPQATLAWQPAKLPTNTFQNKLSFGSTWQATKGKQDKSENGHFRDQLNIRKPIKPPSLSSSSLALAGRRFGKLFDFEGGGT